MALVEQRLGALVEVATPPQFLRQGARCCTKVLGDLKDETVVTPADSRGCVKYCGNCWHELWQPQAERVSRPAAAVTQQSRARVFAQWTAKRYHMVLLLGEVLPAAARLRIFPELAAARHKYRCPVEPERERARMRQHKPAHHHPNESRHSRHVLLALYYQSFGQNLSARVKLND